MIEKRFQFFAGGEPRSFALLFEKVQMQSPTGAKKAPRSAYVKSIREPSSFCSWNTRQVAESVASCKVEPASACVFVSLTQQASPTILDTLRRGALAAKPSTNAHSYRGPGYRRRLSSRRHRARHSLPQKTA